MGGGGYPFRVPDLARSGERAGQRKSGGGTGGRGGGTGVDFPKEAEDVWSPRLLLVLTSCFLVDTTPPFIVYTDETMKQRLET